LSYRTILSSGSAGNRVNKWSLSRKVLANAPRVFPFQLELQLLISQAIGWMLTQMIPKPQLFRYAGMTLVADVNLVCLNTSDIAFEKMMPGR
jgi:hypothetical protein